MKDWVLLGEQSEAGIVFQLGVNRITGKHYRFEPLATKLKNGAVGLLRREIEARTIIADTPEPGIMPVIGPFFHRDRYWLGWEERRGTNPLFAPEQSLAAPLKQALPSIAPLIHSYRVWRQAGLKVGRPEWSRLAKDTKGLFMPDPKFVSYLARPDSKLPIALEYCRPPEEYQGLLAGVSGDVFYLGITIYIYLAGVLPYVLEKDWPTRALLAGKIIPLEYHRSEVPSELGQLVTSMLAPDPLRRPPIEMVEAKWDYICSITEADSERIIAVNLRKQGHFKRRQLLNQVFHKCRVFFLLVILLILGWGVFSFKPVKVINENPVKAATDFYRQVRFPNSRFVNTVGESKITTDFIMAGRRRFETVSKLISKPLFDVTKINPVAENSNSAVVEVELVWWEWAGGGWQRKASRERLVFVKKKGRLTLKSREKMSDNEVF